jgi:hypothetical protein
MRLFEPATTVLTRLTQFGAGAPALESRAISL